MSIAEKLETSLQSILAHQPWYGPAIYDILDGISFEAAYEKPPGSVHSIAGILMHMLGWTQELLNACMAKRLVTQQAATGLIPASPTNKGGSI
jgi:hypothetical protein